MRVRLRISDDEMRAALADIDRWDRTRRARLAAVLRDHGRIVAEDARRLAPVSARPRHEVHYRDTIRMDDSEVESKLRVTVGSEVFYGVFLERGTSKMSARPHLQPALESDLPALQRDLRRAMR